jgi:hypothetical protein
MLPVAPGVIPKRNSSLNKISANKMAKQRFISAKQNGKKIYFASTR